jgi:DNA-binding NarL/FixJ family response regulator
VKKIFIIEDEIIVAKSIESILKNNGYAVPGIATSYKEAKELIIISDPDLILCDINLNEDKSGIDIMKELDFKYNIPFIFVTAYDSIEVVKAAMGTQPVNYITKPFNEKQLLVSLATAFEKFDKTEHNQPTNKEIHILKLLAKGYSSKEIAEKLSLSYHTIESHRKNMLTKFNVKNIANLVYLATSKGWIKKGDVDL